MLSALVIHDSDADIPIIASTVLNLICRNTFLNETYSTDITLAVHSTFNFWEIVNLVFTCITLVTLLMCSSRKYPCPPQGMLSDNTNKKGEGNFQKPKFLKDIMKLNWNFQGLRGLKLENLLWEEHEYFLKQPNLGSFEYSVWAYT